MTKRTLKPQVSRPPALPRAPLPWAQEFLAHYFSDPPCAFHVQLLDVLTDPRQRLIARVAPRGHAKSTCATLAYPLWCICARQRRNIIIITHEASLATQFVGDIRRELESNERIIAEYGDLGVQEGIEGSRDQAREGSRSIGGADGQREGANGGSASGSKKRKTGAGRERSQKPPTPRRTRRKWAEGRFTTATGVTVQAKGSGASLRGTRVGPHRPDLIICDDLETDEQVRSPERRRKLEHWLRRVVMPALAPDGQLLVLGSLIHYDSLLANLRDRQRFPHWDYAVYRALEAELGPDGQYRRVALWPARWPVEKLDLERERIGTDAFQQEYQANPIDETLRTFKPEWLRRYDESELVPERLVTLMAVDPATGADEGDFFALWVGSIDTATGIIYTRQLTLERIGIVEQVKRIVAAFEQWRPVRIGIETTAYQVTLKQILEDESARRGLYLPLVPIHAIGNKIARVQGSSPFYENGMFRLPAVLDPEVEAQFLHFPRTKHDDGPDVCAMGIELARAFRAGVRIEGATAQRGSRGRRDGW